MVLILMKMQTLKGIFTFLEESNFKNFYKFLAYIFKKLATLLLRVFSGHKIFQ
jgi:hypothetical protein